MAIYGEMEGETASRLFHEGGFLILLEVPRGTEIGIDYNSWNVGPKFKGIKMIPPGLHMIYYRHVHIIIHNIALTPQYLVVPSHKKNYVGLRLSSSRWSLLQDIYTCIMHRCMIV